MSELILECVGCENIEVDSFTFFNGCLLCGYCLEDFLSGENSYPGAEHFLAWIKKQRKRMKEDREKASETPSKEHQNE
jgi:hypothetical protein